jgi:hypothetical protein
VKLLSLILPNAGALFSDQVAEAFTQAGKMSAAVS